MLVFPFVSLPASRGRFSAATNKKKKPKKKPKANWFEECTVDQLKQLCKAIEKPVSGSKGLLVQRCLEDPFLGQYGGNSSRKWTLVNVETLKEQCRQRLLQVTGTKFELILRIVQHEKGTGGDSLKRAAPALVTTNADGQPVLKKRKPNKPSAATFYNRVSKKIQACHQKKYQSHWGSKMHAPDVCSLMEKLMSECNSHIENDPQLVCDCYHALVKAFCDYFSSFERPGYCEDLEGMAERIQGFVIQQRSKLTAEHVNKMAEIMLEWAEVGSGYGLLMDYDMEEAVRDMKGETAEEDQKPAAVAKSSPSAKTEATQLSDDGEVAAED